MSRILTRQEAIERLRMKPSQFSKVTNNKVKRLPPLASVRIGRKQLFREETLDQWVLAVEAQSCSAAH